LYTSAIWGRTLATRTTTALAPVPICATRHLYWTQAAFPASQPPNGTIQRATLDGSAVETVASYGDSDVPFGIAVDAEGTRTFWSLLVSGEIRAAELDGSDAEPVLQKSTAKGLAVDARRGRLAARDPRGYGRTYTIRLRCKDRQGHGVTRRVAVEVYGRPH
jgi:hypothetical protein